MAGRDAHIRRAILRSTVFRGQNVTLVDDGDIAFTWAHRDRVTQGDFMLEHEAASRTRVGTTYNVRIYNGITLIRIQLESLMISGRIHGYVYS